MCQGKEYTVWRKKQKMKQNLVFCLSNRTGCIRRQWRKTTVLSYNRCLIKTGEQYINICQSFDHQMSLSKNKCCYSNNCLQLFTPLQGAVPFDFLPTFSQTSMAHKDSQLIAQMSNFLKRKSLGKAQLMEWLGTLKMKVRVGRLILVSLLVIDQMAS